MSSLELAACVTFLLGYFPYFWVVYRGNVPPPVAPWAVWATMDTILSVQMYAAGTFNFQVGGAAVGSWLMTFYLLYKGAARHWDKLQTQCIVGSAIGILLSFTLNVTAGIVVNSIVIVYAGIPIGVAAWKNPHEDALLTWVLWMVSCVFLAFTLEKPWTIDSSMQLICYTINEVMMISILTYRRLQLKSARNETLSSR